MGNRTSYLASEKTQSILQNAKKFKGIPNGTFINNTIMTFGELSPATAKILGKACTNEMESLDKIEECASALERAEIKERREELKDILRYFDMTVGVTFDEPAASFSTIELKDAFLIYPNDFIVVNKDRASEATAAYCIECRHSDELGIPHFLYLCTEEEAETGPDYEEIDNLCARAWPAFQPEVLEKQVPLISNPDAPGTYTNLQEYIAAPTVGYYRIQTEGDPKLPADYEFPLGVKIVKERV